MSYARYISLGGGRQSTAMVYMAGTGEIDADFAIFADTGSERPDTYRYLRDELLPRAKIPVFWLGTGRPLEERRLVGVPTFTLIDGKKGMRRRTCTDHWKIRIMRRWLRSRGVRSATCLLGFTTDESDRMFDSDVKWSRNAYPLIDAGMSLTDCLRWYVDRGLPVPPKSSCYFCPMHSAAYWREMRDRDPVSFAKAERAEELNETFLTVARIPLRQAIDLLPHNEWSETNCVRGCFT